jgi:hypothetical protein
MTSPSEGDLNISAKNTLLIVACMALSVGCPNRATVESCGDLRIRDNVVMPYGLSITDCERAEELAREVAKGREIIVYSRSGDCVLVESGSAARFVCKEGGRGDGVGEGATPLRDDERRIPGQIWVRGDELIDYQLILVNEGAAEVSTASQE